MEQFVTSQQAQQIVEKQKAFYRQGKTRSYEYRIQQLDKLYQAITAHMEPIQQALKQDLGKSHCESYMSEIGMVLSSISHTKKHLKKWMKAQKVKTPMHSFGATSRIEFEPFGSVLVLGPYNYPFQLLIEPLVGAMAAGNCCVLSPSELTPHVSAVIQKMIGQIFSPEYVCCVEGGIETNTSLLHSRFDYIFFTGSVNVGKIVMKAAAENLIPVTLELGGKSPVIVDKTANLKVICQRLAWGKFMNAGQTCVAPDYVLVHRDVFEAFVEQMKQTILQFYGENIEKSPDFGRIVNERHMKRLSSILEKDKAFLRFGGKVDMQQRYIEPTILCPDSFEAACMQEELFGPILPVFPYKDLQEAISYINGGETPLALYVCSEDKAMVQQVLQQVPSGGVSVNDAISHIINEDLPFGGKGHSGMGNYHGKHSFLTFSHKRAVLDKTTRINITLAFPPYNKEKLEKIKGIFK